ncbi:unnamed protein product [Rotaria sp. Silwood2]|nr:unnamed protein product [Rotaria sp. Silwood2]
MQQYLRLFLALILISSITTTYEKIHAEVAASNRCTSSRQCARERTGHDPCGSGSSSFIMYSTADPKSLVGYQILVHHNEQRVLLHPVQILYDERMKDISVMEIPSEQQRARQLMLATAFSALHTKSTSEYINKLPRLDECD